MQRAIASKGKARVRVRVTLRVGGKHVDLLSFTSFHHPFHLHTHTYTHTRI